MLQTINNQEDTVLSGSKNLIQKSFSENTKNTIRLVANTDFHYLLLAENSESKIIFETKGENIKGNIYAIYFGSKPIKSDIQVNISSSNVDINVFMLSLLVSDQEFNTNGNIYLLKDIHNSQGHLLQKNLILGEKIKVSSIPRLDVYSNDIKASHGFSIDRLNQDKMFYLNSKGLSESTSKELIVHGNIKDILNKFTNLSEEQKNAIEDLILSKT
ncbi:MAG TPA: SufD family Fe-S cluster assembly protein [Candidatus Absconditabacterales bacterium]|nr:SufD family Fe-S cluster assembly protein [Candidatus Absconditabacterales bacterium]HOQ79149.1 SufD family Fe-S cluster assembly protein [Candidatus Absconditabacterales bacterium]HPK28238.1 SufD family Fe-S cluster assembly protein [Candidatus Absconditabacterales bacterium]